jgi:hypothetical protein
MFGRKEIVLSLVIGLMSVGGCNNDPTPNPKVNKTDDVVQKSALVKETKSGVERIVFVGKKDACDCTRKQIDTTWEALQSVLKGGPEIAVTRLQVDVDVEEANRYNAMQPLMALPGVYFLDRNNEVAKLLQGEQRVDEIAEALQ